MKYALIIGNDRYVDPKLAQLKTPAADSQALAKVLKDQSIGSFDEVIQIVNKTKDEVSHAIGAFLSNKRLDDLVLLYFSGHGVLDERGRLFLAVQDTLTDNILRATAIPSSFVVDELDNCRSKRQILILDCCHSGAFGRGVKAGEQRAVTETTFEGNGFGRVVLTASDSTQYALEGDQVIKQTELSLFTHFLLEGLQTGKADTNNDGYVSLDEWYDYTYSQVLSTTPKQVPHKWAYNQRGDLVIAKNPYVKKKVVELPSELVRLLESPYSGAKEIAVTELGGLIRSHNSELADLARLTLKRLKEDDSRTVSLAAERLLLEFEKANISSTDAAIHPKAASEIKSLISAERSSREPEKANLLDNGSIAPQIAQKEVEKKPAVRLPHPILKPSTEATIREKSTNIGFITLSVFLVLYSLALFGLANPGIILGILAPLAGGFFVAEKEKRKNIGFMILSAFLVLYGLTVFGLAIPSIIFGILALGAAVLILIGR